MRYNLTNCLVLSGKNSVTNKYESMIPFMVRLDDYIPNVNCYEINVDHGELSEQDIVDLVLTLIMSSHFVSIFIPEDWLISKIQVATAIYNETRRRGINLYAYQTPCNISIPEDTTQLAEWIEDGRALDLEMPHLYKIKIKLDQTYIKVPVKPIK